MTKKSVLIINTFPIEQAQTGGQKREEAIVQSYKKSGFFKKVQYVGVFFKEHYKYYATTDIALPPELTETMHQNPHTGDIVCGNAIFDNPTVKRKMTALLLTLKPDIVQIEQVFPYFGMKRLLAELGMEPKIIFSSHNVEAPHKREILESVHMPQADIERIVKDIAAIENDLAKHSDLVIACTEADKKFYEKQGATNTVLARNGMAPIKASEAAVTRRQQYFSDQGIAKRAVFIGSAHPPNWVGFLTMVGLGVGFMPFNSRLLLAGGICDYFRDTVNEPYNPLHYTFWKRVVAVGRPDNDDLAAIITLADAIILPMTEGGGSNLKTAEAVLSGRPVVGTSHAFRSFEELKNLPNVYIADTKEAFQAAMVTAMNEPIQKRTPAQKQLADSVLWDNCLAEAVKKAGAL